LAPGRFANGDEIVRSCTTMPTEFLPMLATAGVMPSGPKWAFEVKWDGVRALTFVRGGHIRVLGRNGREITARYPELEALGDALGNRSVVLDGEIIACDEAGLPSFELLQERMHVDDPATVAALRARVPVVYMIFDLVTLDDDPLTAMSYLERRELLAALHLDGPNWKTSPYAVGDSTTISAFTIEHGIEGVVAKRVDSRYELGHRSPNWRKIKNTRRQEFVIGGWTPGERGRSGDIGALVLGVYEPGDDGEHRLRCCGKVGSGFTQDTLTQLRAQLAPLARETSPFELGDVPRRAQFVEPALVAEVRFAQWTRGHVVRAAVFLGMRTDKDPTAIVRET
jgi:bifunctional non-homologous end joining protein LigD